MHYFIPAWTHEITQDAYELPWYRSATTQHMDDVARAARLLRSSSYAENTCIVSVDYNPRFRHQLQYQGLYGVAYWSVFDAIQDLEESYVQPFSFYSLDWPEQTEFVYTNFSVLALIDEELYAVIEFDKEGNFLYLDRFEGGQKVSRLFYDDRGFLSSLIAYANDVPLAQVYFDSKGEWKLRNNMVDHVVEVNPEQNTYLLSFGRTRKKCVFSQMTYASYEDLVAEVLQSFVALGTERDFYYGAFSTEHAYLFNGTVRFVHQPTALIDEGRAEGLSINALELLKRHPGQTIAVSETLRKDLRNKGVPYTRVISPYWVDDNYPERTKIPPESVLVPVDFLGPRVLSNLMRHLLVFMRKHQDVELYLLTQIAGRERTKELAERLEALLPTEDDQALLERIQIKQCTDEVALVNCFLSTRVLCDVAPSQTFEVQNLSLVYGIPQVVLHESEIAKNGQNAFVIHAISDAVRGIEYYLFNLPRCNEAEIAAVQLSQVKTKKHLVKQWEEVLVDHG